MNKIKHMKLYSEKVTRHITAVHNDNNIGIAICNPSDQFCKRVGRELATNMLNTNPIVVPQNLSKLTHSEIEVIVLTIVKSRINTHAGCVVY